MDFLEPGLERWHDFFLLAGTAAATLLGLLFVSVSLKTEIIMRGSRTHLRAMAMSAFDSLLLATVLSLIALAPFSRPRLLGVMLLAVGIVWGVRTLLHVIAASRGDASLEARALRRRLVLPVAACAFIAWSGGEWFAGQRNAGLLLFAATLWLLITAVRSAWHLLSEVGEAK